MIIFQSKKSKRLLSLFFLITSFITSCFHTGSMKKKKAMVVTAHPLATKAALEQIKKGGNAADAFVTASLMLSVVTPQSTGIGGGGFLLYYNKKNKKTSVYDFRERAPLASTETMFVDSKGRKKPFKHKDTQVNNASLNGPLSVGVPGLIAGLWKAHQKYGKLPWKTLVEPAIKAAREGFVIDHYLGEALKKRASVLALFEDSKKIFFKNGKVLSKRDILVQEDLAKTLEIIQKEGRDGFYKGSVAKAIIETTSKGGILSQKDLDIYTVKKRKAIVSTYKSYTLNSMPPPSSGGLHVAQILNILENDCLSALGPTNPEAVHLVAEAMRRAYRDRSAFLGDPDFFAVPRKELLSKDYGKKLRETINKDKAFQIKAHEKTSFYSESDSTTHFSIVDTEGNAVSSTQTINYSFGSCVVAKGTGIVLNDEMDDFSSAPGTANIYGLTGSSANKIEPRKTMLSSMSPSFIFSKEGKLILVLGSPGGSRIITATLQTILNVLEYKMPLARALNFPRFHQQWLPNRLYIEQKDFPKETLKKLKEKGHTLKTPKYTMGNVQAIHIKKDGSLVGASDKRGVGSAKGF